MISTDIPDLGSAYFTNLKKYHGITGKLLSFLGFAVKVVDPNTQDIFYIKTQQIVNKLIGPNSDLSKKSKMLVHDRVLEIIAPDTRKEASMAKIQELFNRFYETSEEVDLTLPNDSDTVISKLETIKLDLSDIQPIYYDNSLIEIVHQLQEGDIIVRKYHEDNDNPICDAQKFFGKQGYREAFKCSHLAVYLGQINGEYWVAESSMPNAADAQMRRIKIDDPRFDLREKNQYLVIRRTDPVAAQESAKIARNYVTKMLPASEQIALEEDLNVSLKYSIPEAVRSLWHSSQLGFFGKHRLFKHYSDYKNGIAFEYLGQDRPFFCSHFVLLMESLAELNQSQSFQDLIAKHGVPKRYDHTKKGLSLKISKIWYSFRKGIWSRWMALRYGNEISQSVKTHLDALRTSPQSALIYMMDHTNEYQVLGAVTHRSDYHPINDDLDS